MKRRRVRGRSRIIGQVLLAVILATWLGVFQTKVWMGSSLLTSSTINGDAPNMTVDSQHANGATELDTKSSSWYGWQPEIHPEPDCSWRKCFKENHGCRTTCRDEPEAMGSAPKDIPLDWVPDVTMLRRMFLAQTDADGNPWPPPLSKELCEPIGDSGDRNDPDKILFDAVPIVAEPLNRTDGGPKILCMIYTMAPAHALRVRAIRETWAGGCDGFLAFSTESDPRIPAISIPHDGDEFYDNMWQKVRSIWRYASDHYVNDFDFFILGGDDMFVLPQNLRSYLATVGSPDERLFVGRPLKLNAEDLYNSGGAGYILSRGTLKVFAKDGLNDARCAPENVTSMEDVMIARCLRLAFGIGLTNTSDAQGRHRFHPGPPGWHYHWIPNPVDWYYHQALELGVKFGADCCAPDSVSFHHLKKPAVIRHVFSLLYDSNCQRQNVDDGNKRSMWQMARAIWRFVRHDYK